MNCAMLEWSNAVKTEPATQLPECIEGPEAFHRFDEGVNADSFRSALHACAPRARV
jgi:hypothetical protein